MIRIRGLCKRFGATAVLDDVHAEAPAGAIVALLGPSGSGKSTLIRCLNGLSAFDAGELEIAGFRLQGGKPPAAGELLRLRAAVGMVFQDLHLFPHLSVLDNVTLAPRVVGKLGRAQAERHARSLLEHLGLAERAHSRPFELSGGQRQRIAIARAVAQGARVLLLDEPTSALDPALRKDVAALLKRVASGEVSASEKADPLTLVVVTHDEGIASELATVTWRLDAGKIRA
ncbi:MAG TPA: ATP-binding cassette domain-containing protein [Polyangiaceae bacterium]|jgi:ABC-type polar amino acid transport system ATPase subunit|nr:ATP-binding cassette domain-containing protein [Polyangiaceae bacterium]